MAISIHVRLPGTPEDSNYDLPIGNYHNGKLPSSMAPYVGKSPSIGYRPMPYIGKMAPDLRGRLPGSDLLGRELLPGYYGNDYLPIGNYHPQSMWTCYVNSQRMFTYMLTGDSCIGVIPSQGSYLSSPAILYAAPRHSS